MGANSFGNIFKITTWGESHGKAIGVVIDGCPAGLTLADEDINQELAYRRPGRNAYVSPRNEKDEAQIYSGVFEGKTTGAPISIIIFNQDHHSQAYEPIKDLLRPGHANYTYLKKYGVFDYRGGGRASGRETVTRVAAGAVAKKLLALFGVEVVAYMAQIAGIQVKERETLPSWETIREHPIFCPDEEEGEKMIAKLTEIQEEGDSIGGTVEVITSSLPVGLGDPIYEKLEANLGKAMLSIPASKGFELGSGFHGVNMKGSEHNDLFVRNEKGSVTLKTNFSGGTLGGISSGMPLHFRVAFKPASSIKRIQETLTTGAEPAQLKLGKEGRHDPCVAIRAVPVVKSMTELVLIDALLMNKYCKIDN